MFLIIIICIIMVGISYWLYERFKAMYIVRKFFKRSTQIENFYELFILKKNNDSDLQLQVTIEDIQEVLYLTEETISDYDNCLKEFEEPTINSTYSKLREIATELRRILLWNNN